MHHTNHNEVKTLLSMTECIEVMRDLFANKSQDTLLNPLRTKMWLPNNVGVLGMMPAYIKGWGVITAKHIVGDIVGLLAQTCVGRTNDAEITVFKSLGLGIEDVAAAYFIYEKQNLILNTPRVLGA